MLNHHRLPLYAALAAFLVYVSTMGAGLTLTGASLAAQLAGWNDVPLVGQPLLWLFTLPLRLLPMAFLPLALKLAAAGMAAIILGLLTRTMQLLPWDHPWDQASRLASLLPVLTAGVVCGLEFFFWREATSTCGDLLDLLLLAAAVWLLLEYNVRQQARWLNAATVVWGLGMAENWVMLFAWPLFVAAVIWLEGLRFFRWKLILRLAGLGLAGVSVYAVLPLANSLLPHSSWTLRESWLASLHQTKSVGHLLYAGFWRGHLQVTMAVAICFFVPTLPLLVRLRDEGTRNKSPVDRFQVRLYRSLRLALLLACFWLALDPIPGARQMIHSELGMRGWMPLLTFDYLNALGAAFLLGNLLLISQSGGREPQRRSRSKPWRRLIAPLAAGGLGVAALALLARNAPAIWRLNFHPLEQFGEEAVNSLPPGSGVVLSDDPDRLLVFRAALARRGRTADWLAVQAHALPQVEYRARLEQSRPAGWLTDASRHELTPVETVRLLEHVARTNRLFYLHPSYGLFLEAFYLAPTGSVYELKLRGRNPLEIPALGRDEQEANELFWNRLWENDLSSLATPPPVGWRTRLAQYGFTPAPRDQDRVLADWYATALEAWAVTLQKAGRWREAQARFEEVLQLNTNNFSARLSLACNANLQAGREMAITDSPLASELADLERMNLFLRNNGPFDTPPLDYVFGSELFDHGLLLQASEVLERTRQLAPNALAPEMVLAEIYNRLQMPDRSRALITRLRESTNAPYRGAFDLNLALLDSYSWLLQSNTANARDALQSVVKEHPDDPQIANRVVAAYLAFGDLTNAMQLIERRLANAPDDVASLNSKGMILLQSGQAAEAVPIWDHVLTLTNLPAARINRAFARMALQDFDSAKSELLALEQTGSSGGMADWGLAMVAEHAFDTNSARHYLQCCLTNTPTGGALWRQASARLRGLEPVAPAK